MNFRLSAFALLTFLLAISQAYGQASGASYQQSISQAATALTVNSSSSVVGLESPPTLSAVISFPNSGQTTGNVTFTAENGSTVIATGTAPVNLSGVATWSPSLPSGTFTIFAVYSGDSNLLGSTSPAIPQTVLGPADFSFSVSPFSVAQGQSAATPVSVTAINASTPDELFADFEISGRKRPGAYIASYGIQAIVIVLLSIITLTTKAPVLIQRSLSRR